MEFGEKLRQLLKEKEMSQRAFADKIGISPTYLNKFFTGRTPNMEFLTKVIEVFPEVNLNWLLFSQEPPEEKLMLLEGRAPYNTDKVIKYLEEIEERIAKIKLALSQN